jgi:riboflavin kinase/FMN adenylyltransferase
MPEIRLFTRKETKECILALGTFDGVHRGHVRLLSETVRLASETGLRSGVFFFSLPPAFYRGSESGLLTTPGQRCDIFRDLGLDFAVIADFPAFRDIGAGEFVSRVLIDRLGCRGTVCGFDYRFGAGRAGTPELLSSAFGGSHVTVGECTYGGATVSSSAIRELVRGGRVREAAELAGRHFCHRSPVLRGRGDGKKLGFPTLNQLPSPHCAVPRPGVYVTRCSAGDGRSFASVTDVGTSPTLDGSGPVRYETHVPGFSGDLYGRTVTVSFIDRIRDEMRFSSAAELSEQIGRDAAYSERYFSTHESTDP